MKPVICNHIVQHRWKVDVPRKPLHTAKNVLLCVWKGRRKILCYKASGLAYLNAISLLNKIHLTGSLK